VLSRDRLQPLKWAAGLYLAGVLAHSGHHMADEPGMACRSDRDLD
jgi:hypothetical protein